MSDLISRSALLKKLESMTNDNSKYIRNNSHQFTYKELAYIICNQPTAYDVEKVVEELKEWSFETEIVIPTSDGFEDIENREIICTLNAIDIVRKGGVE